MTATASRVERDLDEIRRLAAEGAALVGEQGTGAGSDAYEQRVETARRAVRWAAETFGKDLTVASSMGDEVLVHLVGTTVPGTDVFFLDTGYHFAETLGTRDAYAAMLPIRMRTVLPLQTVAEQDAEYGPRLHDRDPNLCCFLRKVEPLARSLEGRAAWVTGVRRVEAPTRAATPVVVWDDTHDLVKVNPLVAWSDEDVEAYQVAHDLPRNPLVAQGYPSIGCAPCTRKVAPGEDPRAGRWSGKDKTECGIHT